MRCQIIRFVKGRLHIVFMLSQFAHKRYYDMKILVSDFFQEQFGLLSHVHTASLPETERYSAVFPQIQSTITIIIQ